MALNLYTSADESAALSQAGAFTNPFALTFDGRSGGIKESRLYIRNDDALLYYTSITLKVQDLSGNPIVDDTANGFAWKLSQGDLQPTVNDWANIAAANTISFPDIGASGTPDTSTYLPYWVYTQIPPGIDVQTFNSVQFVLQGEENLI